MPLLLKIEILAKGPVSLRGELAVDELQMETLDELIKIGGPLEYDLTAKRAGDTISLQGSMGMHLKCECARCLQPFEYRVELQDWSCFIPLSGKGNIQLINDSADLTPYLREDTFLAFPQHPLCGSECGGIAKMAEIRENPTHSEQPPDEPKDENVWAELDKLNLK